MTNDDAVVGYVHSIDDSGGVTFGEYPPFMTFSEALEQLKSGKLVTNTNWNGNGMFLFAQKGYPDGIPANENTATAMGIPEGNTIFVSPYIMMRNARAELVPWTPSQMDLFSDGWMIVVENEDENEDEN